MRVDPKVGAAQVHATPASTGVTRAREVKLERTQVSRAEIRGAIKRALVKVDGAQPSDKLVDTLTAHSSLETASGDRMFNYNFAGIKGHSPSGMTAVARTREVLGGKDVEIRDGFRAYATLDEGGVDYVRTMKGRFSGALAPAARGDVAGFAHALKSAGYYTAAESDYARGLAGLMGLPATGAAREGSSQLAKGYVPHELGSLSSQGLARVEGALDRGRWLDALGASPTTRSHHAEGEEDDS